MPFALIGAVPIIMGGLGLVSFILAPATLTVISGGIGGFFTALTTFPFVFPIALFIIILFTALAGLTLFIVMIVGGAFILPSKVAEVTPVTISPYLSDYFELTKTVFPDKLSNEQVEDGEIIEYSISIKPKGNYVLKVNSFEENFTVFNEGSSLAVNNSDCQFTSEEVQEAIDNSQPLECFINIDSRFKNSSISNTVTLKTGIKDIKDTFGEEISGIHMGTANAMVIIGNPPGDCPLIWPVDGDITISRLPCEPLTLGGVTTYHGQSIDIPGTREVVATHTGTVVFAGNKSGYGLTVEIKGLCNGIEFVSRYAHLSTIRVKLGDQVVPKTPLGISGNTGRSTGVHLHYQFVYGLEMQCYNIPRCIQNFCN
jgi:murein DD-endopeptidase MepM/ murein hydrolase activator NlpD